MNVQGSKKTQESARLTWSIYFVSLLIQVCALFFGAGVLGILQPGEFLGLLLYPFVMIALFGTPVFALTWSILYVHLLQRRINRETEGQGRCLQCDYDLTGNVTGRCSECGKVVEGAGRVAEYPGRTGGRPDSDEE